MMATALPTDTPSRPALWPLASQSATRALHVWADDFFNRIRFSKKPALGMREH
jgi:hypothetical protein